MIATLQLGQVGRAEEGLKQGPAFANVKLLLNGESSPIVDGSPNGYTVTANGGAGITSTDIVAGASSMLFDGTDDYLLIGAATDWDFGGSNFSVEMKLRPSAFGTAPTPLNTRSPHPSIHDGGLEFQMNSSTLGGYFAWYDGGGGAAVLSIPNGTFAVGRLTNIGVFREGSTWRLFVDGAMQATGTPGATPRGSKAIAVGAANHLGSPSRWYAGRLEVRISTECWHTGAGPYRPPMVFASS
jgi:hypothetical protein